MGLDMYLTKKRFMWTEDRDSTELRKVSDKFGNGAEVSRVEFETGYWRKANSIHKWFVDNVQGGKDDCEQYEVSRDQLRELLTQINIVLGDNKLAEKILPCQSGFFFGETVYNDWYFKDLRYTKELLESILNLPEKEDKGEYYYSSSW
jgi:hypothetical protein